MTKPTIGRIVVYTVSDQDAEKINRRRTTLASLAERILTGFWHPGAQAHVGNEVKGGQKFPMMIVAVHGDSEGASVNGQVFMDGNDQFWTLSVAQDDSGKPGTFAFTFTSAQAAAPSKATARPATQPSRPSAPKEDAPTEPPKE